MSALLKRILSGEQVERPPVWFMRQAGRCLASYRELRAKHGFLELMEVPELACEVTLQPVRELGVDAAILFSDILVIPRAMGQELQFNDGVGPRLSPPLKDVASPLEILNTDPQLWRPSCEALSLICSQLSPEITPIGFCGGPLTVACYMIQGLGGKGEFPEAVDCYYRQPDVWHALMEELCLASSQYLVEQVEHGAQVIQVFETWAGILPADEYWQNIWPYTRRMLEAASQAGAKTIFFPRGMGAGLKGLEQDIVDGVGIDWQCSLRDAREMLGPKVVLQGNLDPRLVQVGGKRMQDAVDRQLDFSRQDGRVVFNFGHGVLPDTAEENLRWIVNRVKGS